MSCKSKVTIFWDSTWAEESACFMQFLMLISWWVILNFSFHILLRPRLSKFVSVIFYNKGRVIFMNAGLDFCAVWCTCEYYLSLGKINEKLLIFTFPINYTLFFCNEFLIFFEIFLRIVLNKIWDSVVLHLLGTSHWMLVSVVDPVELFI